MVLKGFTFMLLLLFMEQTYSWDYIPERSCGILFSETAFNGETFRLNDFDQSINLKKDYRNSLAGWKQTGSIQALDGCRMTMCSNTYFSGICHSLQYNNLSSVSFDVNSVNCTCKRKCKCENLNLPVDFNTRGYAARAYLQRDCDTCDSDYLHVFKGWVFPEKYKTSVRTFLIPKGCSLTVYGTKEFKDLQGTFRGPIYKGFRGTLQRATTLCDQGRHVDFENVLIQKENLTDISAVNEDIDNFKLLLLDDTFSNKALHQATNKSVENRRSGKTAYVILIGVKTAYYTGFPQCKENDNVIWTCTIAVHLSEFGVWTWLVIIIVPLAKSTDDYDYTLMATFEEFLLNHPVLKNAIPNAIIIDEYFTRNDFAKRIKALRRNFKFVQALGSLVLDESYPNVIFMLDRLNDLSEKDSRQPDKKIEEFEKEINKIWPFPVNICVLPSVIRDPIFRNGHMRMKNEEYYPLNLKRILENVCKHGGDPYGQTIFKNYFYDNKSEHYYKQSISIANTKNATNINKFRKLFANFT